MAKEIIKNWLGLNTAASYASLEPGYLGQADNCLILEPSLIEARPGFFGITLPGNVAKVTGASSFNASPTPNGVGLFINTLTSAGAGSVLKYFNGAWVSGNVTNAFLQNANVSPPAGFNFNRWISSSGSTYFTSSIGLMKIDQPGTSSFSAVPAGQSEPMTATAVLGSTVGPPLNSNSSTAYRATLSHFDNNGILIESAPTARVVITNPPNAGLTATVGTGATFNVAVNPATGAITGVTVLSGGTGYTGVSTASFTGSGSGAAANLTVSAGAIIAVVITNPGAGYVSPKNVQVTVFLPPDATTSTIVNLYRAPQVDQSFGTISPSDQMFKVYQAFLTTGQINGGTVTINDIQPDALLYQSPFYVNTLPLGIEEEYDQPAMGVDVANFRNRLWTANTRIPNSITTTYIGGLNLGDNITVNGVPFVAISGTPSLGLPQFQLVTSGSVAFNIENTIRSLCAQVSIYFDTPANIGANGGKIECSYSSGFNAAPGAVIFSEVGVGGQAFVVTSNRAGAGLFSPDLPQTSVNEAQPNRIYYSEDGLPDAMPNSSNSLDVGSSDKQILRILLIGQTLFIFKEDGLYKITGFTASDFNVSQVNPEIRLVNPQALCVISNTIFCLTRQGIHAVTEAGAVLLSRPIDDKIKQFVGVINSNPLLLQNAFAVGSEAKHYVLFGLPASVADPYCSLQVAYCLANNTWTTWSLPNLYYGFSDISSQMFLFQHDPFQGHRMLVERITGTYLDNQDPGFTLASPTTLGNSPSVILSPDGDFSTAPWTNDGANLITSVATGVLAPDGTNTAQTVKLGTSAGTTSQRFYQSVGNYSPGTTYQITAYFKPGTADGITLVSAGGVGFGVYVSNAGVVTPFLGSGFTTAVTSAPNGYLKVVVTWLCNVSTDFLICYIGQQLNSQVAGATVTLWQLAVQVANNVVIPPGATQTLTFPVEPGLSIGDILFQSSTGSYATVLNISDTGQNNPRNNIITLDQVYVFDATAIQVFESISSVVQPLPFRGGDDSQITDWKSFYARFNRNDGLLVTVSTSTEITTTDFVDQRFLTEGLAFGAIAYGQKAYGGKTRDDKIVVKLSAPEYGKSAVLNISLAVGNALQPWSLGTLAVLFDPVTDELRK